MPSLNGIILDGSLGEGGGQILRTALSLSVVTGKPFFIEKIRAGRERPGLLRQHLAAVLAAAEIGDAEVEGAYAGSTQLSFKPTAIKPGTYNFLRGHRGERDIGSANHPARSDDGICAEPYHHPGRHA